MYNDVLKTETFILKVFEIMNFSDFMLLFAVRTEIQLVLFNPFLYCNISIFMKLFYQSTFAIPFHIYSLKTRT